MSVPEGATHRNTVNGYFYKVEGDRVLSWSAGTREWKRAEYRETPACLVADGIVRIAPQQPAAPQTAEADSGWVPWHGSVHSPIGRGLTHEVRFRNGSSKVDGKPETWRWSHVGNGHDIVAYRIVKPAEPAKAEPQAEQWFDKPMTLDAFAQSVGEDCGDHYRRLVEMRGGCRCCISPPCNACVDPMDEAEALELGWIPPEETPACITEGDRAGIAEFVPPPERVKPEPVRAELPKHKGAGLLVVWNPDARRFS